MDKLEERGFLSRWSRLKQGEEEAAPVVVEAANSPEIVADGSAPAAREEPGDAPAPLLSDADLPDPDALDVHSDFSGFLGEGISEALRRKALKKLFHLPEFNLRDGLNEYDDDYSSFEPLGDTVTYQMKQWLERQKSDFQEALEGEGEAGDESGEPCPLPEARPEPAGMGGEDEPLGEADG